MNVRFQVGAIKRDEKYKYKFNITRKNLQVRYNIIVSKGASIEMNKEQYSSVR